MLDYKTLLGYENFQIALINDDFSQAKFTTKPRFQNVNSLTLEDEKNNLKNAKGLRKFEA